MDSKTASRRGHHNRSDINANNDTHRDEILIHHSYTETDHYTKYLSSGNGYNEKMLKSEEKRISTAESGSNNRKSHFNLLGILKSIKDRSSKSIDKPVIPPVIDRPNRTIDNDLIEEHSSGDEKLSKAFGVNFSYTRTPRVDSEQYTDSIELENPDIEKSMLTDELRTVNFFLNEEEDDENEDGHSLNRPKNSIKNNSISYASKRKNTMIETSLNPGSVIVIRNKKETSLFSTQDSRKVGHNSAYKNHDAIYLKDLNETDIVGLSTVHEQGEYNTAIEQIDQSVGYGYSPTYNMFDFNGESNFQKYPYENQSMNFTQYLPNIDMSLIKGVGYPNITQGHFSRYPIDQSSENKKQKKGKRNFWKVEDTSEFDIIIDKIYLERKTTLMIRNIPNKYTKELMLETIDAHFKETYDFFYLPIDFKNNCNVGYAFINFKDLKYIEPFFKKFNQKKWAIFNSEKICSIKYARIQGKEECEKHFKDSSLMKQPVC